MVTDSLSCSLKSYFECNQFAKIETKLTTHKAKDEFDSWHSSPNWVLIFGAKVKDYDIDISADIHTIFCSSPSNVVIKQNNDM